MVLYCLGTKKVSVDQEVKKLVNSIEAGTFFWDFGTLRVFLSHSLRSYARWSEDTLVVVWSTGTKEGQGVGDVPLGYLHTRGPVVQDSNVVSQRPAWAAFVGFSTLAEVSEMNM